MGVPLTQAVGLGFARSPLWGSKTTSEHAFPPFPLAGMGETPLLVRRLCAAAPEELGGASQSAKPSLTPPYWGLLKQPDKHEASNRRRAPGGSEKSSSRIKVLPCCPVATNVPAPAFSASVEGQVATPLLAINPADAMPQTSSKWASGESGG